MEKKVMCSANQDAEMLLEQELWSALLHAEGVSCSWTGHDALSEEMFVVDDNPHATISYPWSPASPESEKFLTVLEQHTSLDDWDPAEITNRSGAFFQQIDQLWAAASLQDTLAERFAARMPQNLLTAIVNRAQAVYASTTNLAEQLVHCVQTVVPNLADEDLDVLARPLAYAMRNGGSHQAVETTLAKVRMLAWEELSEIEQARLSLAIARCALAELDAGRNE